MIQLPTHPSIAHHRLLRLRVRDTLAVVWNVRVPEHSEEGGVHCADEVVDRKEVRVDERFVAVLLHKRGILGS